MLRPEFVQRKLQLIAEDLGRLLRYKDESWESITADFVKLAALERLIERIVMRAIDINEHLIAELGSGTESRTARLTYRETFLRLADLGVYPGDFAERIARSASLRNILVHDYNDADRRIICGSVRPCLDDYREYVERVAAYIDGLPGRQA
jgi:uncharacterized protein YutE (UPF0331/DUF86 family)